MTYQTRPDWFDDALCHPSRHGGQPLTGIFFPDDHTDQGYAAKLMCNRCPVAVPCREYGAATSPAHGIWGGIGPRGLRKHRRDTLPDLTKCHLPECDVKFPTRGQKIYCSTAHRMKANALRSREEAAS